MNSKDYLAPIPFSSVPRILIWAAFCLASLLLLAGCSVQESRRGETKKVDIHTPLGGLQVSTDPQAADTGLAVYPGARLKPKSGSDESGANVNISTAVFGLKLAVVRYLSDDSPGKVETFYKNELAKYGEVLVCNPNPAGAVAGAGGKSLRCDHGDLEGATVELKVGIDDHQHIVAIKSNGSGSEFVLVYVNAHEKDPGKDTAL